MAHTRLLTRKTCKGGKAKVSQKFRNKRRSEMTEAMFDLLYIMREVCYIILIIMLWFVSVKYLRSDKWKI